MPTRTAPIIQATSSAAVAAITASERHFAQLFGGAEQNVACSVDLSAHLAASV